MKNIIISSISRFQVRPNVTKVITEDERYFYTIHTNETAIRYIAKELKKKGQRVDKIFSFVTNTVKEKSGNLLSDWEQFKFLINCDCEKDIKVNWSDVKNTISECAENWTDEETKNFYFEQFKKDQSKFDFNINNIGNYTDCVEIEEDFDRALYAPAIMFNKIRKYIEEEKKRDINQEIIVHIDTTGGFRYNAMILLVLIQMLKYGGFIKNEESYILYSNRHEIENNNGKKFVIEVENVNKLTDLFFLVGGIRDFTSFGNIEQLQDYFASNKTLNENNRKDKVSKLVDEMEEFAEAIKRCSAYSHMLKVLFNIKKLIVLLKNVDVEEREKYSYDKLLFYEMISKIEYEYKSILPDDINSKKYMLDIIKWCINKKMVQQAMTFFIEWIPIYLFEEKLIVFNDSEIEEKIEILKKKHYKRWQDNKVYFVKNYWEVYKSLLNENKKSNNIFQVILSDSGFNSKQIDSYGKNLSKINNLEYSLMKYVNICNDFIEENNINFENSIKKLPDEDSIKKSIYLLLDTNKNITLKNIEEKLEENKKDNMKLLNILLQILFKNKEHDINNIFKTIDKKKKSGIELYNLWNNKMIKTKFNYIMLSKIIYGYNKFSDKRNNMNHGNTGKAISYKKDNRKLLTLLSEYIALIESVNRREV